MFIALDIFALLIANYRTVKFPAVKSKLQIDCHCSQLEVKADNCVVCVIIGKFFMIFGCSLKITFEYMKGRINLSIFFVFGCAVLAGKKMMQFCVYLQKFIFVFVCVCQLSPY